MPLAIAKEVVVFNPGLKDLIAQDHVTPGAVGPLNLATVHLWTGLVTPTPNTLEATLTEALVADWAEYAAIAITGWGATETRADGSVIQYATPLLSWTGPAAAGGPLIQGYFVKSPLAGTHLIYGGRFVTPVPMPDASQILDFVLPWAKTGASFTI